MDRQTLDDILTHWGRDPDFAIEILQDIQDSYRYLPEDVLRYAADELGVPLGRLHHLGSFFKAFSFEPRGEHVIQVCMGTACHVKGAPRVLDAFVRELGVPEGGTTPDGKFTVEGVRCVGCCALAPVVQVGDELHGEISPAEAPKMVRQYAEG